MPNVPPPYFPQSMSPPDPAAMRKRRRMFIGCLALAFVGLIALIALIVYFVTRP